MQVASKGVRRFRKVDPIGRIFIVNNDYSCLFYILVLSLVFFESRVMNSNYKLINIRPITIFERVDRCTSATTSRDIFSKLAKLDGQFSSC